MKYFQCFGVFIFLLVSVLGASQAWDSLPLQARWLLDRDGTAYLNPKLEVEICYDVNKCNYIFHCPENITATHAECYYDLKQKRCPNITASGLAPQHGLLPQLIISDLIPANFNSWYGEFRPCAVSVEDIVSDEEFYLEFDRILDKVTIDTNFRTALTGSENFVRCYQRNLNHLLEIGLQYTFDIHQNMTYIYKYILNVTQEPNIYFCILLAPPTIALTKTNEVVAYTNASGNQYIAKVTFIGVPFTVDDLIIRYIPNVHLDEQCGQLNLAVCKVISVKDNVIFLYARDLTWRKFELLKFQAETVLNETLLRMKQEPSKILQINYIRNIDYCLASTTISRGRVLNWSTTARGNITTSFELCLDNHGAQVTRRCEGDFFTGAQWSEPSANCSEYCLPDNTISSNGKELTWDATLARTIATSFELCLDDDGMQVTRRCEEGPQWLEPSGNCSDDVKILEEASKLYQLVKEGNVTNIASETEDFKQFTPVAVNLLSDGLKTMSVARNAINLKDDFFHCVSNLIQVNRSELDISQNKLNATDKILDAIETFQMNMAEDITNLSISVESHLLTHISYPFLSNVVGFGIYGNDQGNFSNCKIASLLWDETFDNLDLENLELAVYIPTDYVKNLTKSFTDEEKNNFKIISTVFYNDGLFNGPTNENRSAGSKVISVNIPVLLDNAEIPIHLLFRPVLNFSDANCTFWDYGRQKYGKWSTSGGEPNGFYKKTSLRSCTFNHITHFALLVLSENIVKVEDEDGVMMMINPLDAHNLPLTLITLIGCGLSFMGLVVILLTAILFKNWYEKRLNTIQLGLTMLMEIVILYVADLKILEASACLAVGALLHYTVVSKFTWMLLIARIQYLKFVKIFDSQQDRSHAIIHILIGWILPIIPVMLGLLSFPDGYQTGNLYFCYAKGRVLYLFVIFPICIVILVNIAIFAAIMVVISKSKARDYGVNVQKIQVRLGIMLLFMLGITWIFGIVGEFLPWSWFMLLCVYLFCILGSTQGFVLFVFTVIFDKTTVKLWTGLLKTTPKRDMPYEGSTNTEVVFTSNYEQVTVNRFRQRDGK